MKSRQILQSSVRCLLPAAAALIASSATVFAQFETPNELKWDADAATEGSQDGSGTWSLTSTNWLKKDPWGFEPDVAMSWENINNGTYEAIFGSGGNATQKNVTVAGDFWVSELTFGDTATNTVAYRLDGGSIRINDGGRIVLDSATISSSLVTLNTVIKGNDLQLLNIGSNGEEYIQLGGANLWTGKLSIGGSGANGRLFVRASNSATLNTLTSIDVKEGSTLSLVGTNSTYTPAITIAGRGDGNRGALRLDQSMTLEGRITLSGDASISTQDSAGTASTVTLTSGIGQGLGSFTLTKSGTGNLIIAAASNYTGETIIGPTSPTSTTAPGTLTLDFSHANAQATNLLYNGVAANTLKLVGTSGTPTLSVKGKDGVTNSQTFSGVEVTNQGVINATSGAGGTLNLNLGAITRTTAGAVLTVAPQGNVSITTSGNGVMPWVNYVGSVFTGWARVNGGILEQLPLDLTYASGSVISSLAGYSANSNMEITAGSSGDVLQGAGTTQLSTITMADTATARTLSVGAGNTLRFGTNGGIQTMPGAKQLTVGSAPSVGSITAGGELFLTNRSAESLVINSVISNNGGAVKVTLNGSGRVQFRGANTYSGETTIGPGGILQIENNTALGSTAGVTTVENGATLALAGNLSNIAEEVSIVGSGVGNGGAIRNISGNNVHTGLVSVKGVSRINSDAGKLIFSSSSPTTNVINGGNSVSFGGEGTIEIQGRYTAGGGGLTKDGTGTLILKGSNSYSSTTTVNAGTLLISNAAALGSATTTTSTGTIVNTSGTLALAGGITTAAELLTLNGTNSNGSLRNLSGNNTYAGAITLGGSARINADAGTTLTLDVASGNAISNSNTARTLTFGGAGNIVVKDPIAHTGTNSLAIVKDGTGTLTLQGTNTHATTGNGATVNSGKLVLDYSSSAAVLNAALGFTLGGGTLEVQGGAANPNPTLGSLSLTATTGISTLAVGSNTTLTIGDTWNRASATMMLIDLSAPGSVLKSSPVSAPASENGLLLGTGGSNASFVIKDGAGRYDFAAVNAGTIGRLNASTALPTSGGTTTSSFVLNAAGTKTLTGNVSSSTVRVDTTANSGVLDLAGKSLGLQRFGLLIDGSNDFTITDSVGGGLVRSSAGTPAVFLYHYGTGKLTLDASITDGGGSGQVFMAGTGLIDWRSTANASGNNYIMGVTTRLSNAGAINLTNATTGNGSGSILLAQGGILELASGDLTRNLTGTGPTGNLNMNIGGSSGDGGGFSAYGADRVVNFSNVTTVTWGTTSGFLGQGKKLILGSPHANAVVDFQEHINLGGGIQTVDVQSINQVGIGGKISGNITGLNGGLAKIGQGILTLSGASDYTGTTSVMEGTLEVTGSINGTSMLSVARNAKLKARGTGSVTAGSFSLLDGSAIDLELGATTATTLIAGDNFSLEGNIKLSLALTTDPLDGTLFTLLDGSGLLTGYSSGARFLFNSTVLNEGASFLVSSNGFDQMFQISYLGGGGADVTLLAVPEPSTGAALLSSMGLLLGLNRFRRRSARQVLRA